MQLSERTIEILRNFSQINPGILITPGFTLRTIKGSAKHVESLARAKVAEKFPRDIAFYSLPMLLAYLSECKSGHEITFEDDNSILIKDQEGRSCKFRGTDPQNIICVRKDFDPPTPDVAVSITEADLKTWLRRAAVLQMPELAFIGDGKQLWVYAVDTKKETGDKNLFHEFGYTIGETDKTFELVLSTEYMKFLPGDYVLGLNIESDANVKGNAHFKGADVEYVVRAEVTKVKGVSFAR